MKLSNKFTFVRIIYAPVFLLLYFIPIWTGKFAELSMYISIPLLIFAEFTDYLDGHYARKRNEVSDFGKMFDPFADVFLHLSTFVCYMFSFDPLGGYMFSFDSLGGYMFSFVPLGGYMHPVLFILIMWREISQNFLRMVAAKQGTAIAARKGGKFKTVMYIASGFYALFLELLVRLDMVPECFGTLKIVSTVLFVICVILSYASFIDYLIHFGKVLKS